MMKVYPDMLQGSDEWYAARCGLLTASEMKHILTPAKLQYSNSEKERTHLYELLGQRITKYVEPRYVSDDMMRGQEDEILAREEYRRNYAQVVEVGFITNNEWGFTLGSSPDGLVSDDGMIECKSRCQKYQIETILADEMPDDYKLQVQTGMLVSGRKWCDFISYCGGMPMFTKRVYADPTVQGAILAASKIFHDKLENYLKVYDDKLKTPGARLIATERRAPQTGQMQVTEDD